MGFIEDLRYFLPSLASARTLALLWRKIRKTWRRRQFAQRMLHVESDRTFTVGLGLPAEIDDRLELLKASLQPIVPSCLPQGNPSEPTMIAERAREVLNGFQRIYNQLVPVGWLPRWDWCWDHLPADHLLRGDHRTRWEVARLAGILPLARAAHGAGDGQDLDGLGAEAAKGYVEAVLDFDRQNQGPSGVAWEHGIEPGLRTIALAQGLALLLSSEAFKASHLALLRVMDRQVLWLQIHLSRDKVVQGNHLLAELAGIVTAGHLLPTARPRWWRGLNPQELLEREILRQFHPDGVSVEQSLTYEKLILEFLLVPIAMAKVRGEPFSEEVRERLLAVVAHLAESTAPDGALPRVGDCDSSRGADWGDEDPHVSEPIVKRAASLLGAIPESRANRGGNARVKTAGRGMQIAEFPDGGHFVVRDRGAGRDHFIFVRCGPFGWGIPGPASHAHADFMAPVLFFCGEEILTDPGVYGYVVGKELRDGLRIWDAHSAISTSPPSGPKPDGIFRWSDIPRPGRLWVETLPGAVVVSGEVQLRTGHRALLWRRSLSYNELLETVDIEDTLSGRFKGPVTWTLRFALGTNLEESDSPGVFRVTTSSGLLVNLVLKPEGSISVEDGVIAPAYGVLLKAPVLRRRFETAPERAKISLTLQRIAAH